jgi:hypothetical protein
MQWLDLGKSNIILDPFAETIAKATVSVARQIPTFHGYGGYGDYAKSLQFEEEEKPPSKVECLRILLKERYAAVKANPGIKTTKRWTQSHIWYTLMFGPFQKYGYTIENHKIKQGKGGTRDYITGLINDTCLELFGVKREELGIVAGHRAEQYFNGSMSSVSMDNVDALARHGTDVIFAEKQDAIEALGYYADMFGLSMVDTHGHLTECT